MAKNRGRWKSRARKEKVMPRSLWGDKVGRMGYGHI